jgi:hypothetical protein
MRQRRSTMHCRRKWLEYWNDLAQAVVLDNGLRAIRVADYAIHLRIAPSVH